MTRVFCSLILAGAMVVATSLTARADITVFLHNAWFEKNKGGEAHKKFGAYDFQGIKAALATAGAAFTAPERGPGASPDEAAAELVAWIRAKLDEGFPASTIKIIGASKGAYIAKLASAKLDNSEIRWVLVGGCHTKRMAAGLAPKMTGVVLSIFDTSDKVAGSCAAYPDMVSKVAKFEETEIATGKNHGFQFTADPAWIDPAKAW